VDKHIIVMNPFARQLRHDKPLRARLRKLLHRSSIHIEAQTVNELLETLKTLSQSQDLHNVRVFVVGGDGTFNQMMNWVANLPPDNQPSLVPVGGGQFNFMARYAGLGSTDPSENLSRIFSGEIELEDHLWRPIAIHDSQSDTTKYAAVVAGGVVSSFVKLYEQNGKGDLVDVVSLMVSATAGHISHLVKGIDTDVSHTLGNLLIDGTRLEPNRFSYVFGAVREFMPSCTPFHHNNDQNKCNLIAYWGMLPILLLAAPKLWFGKPSIFTNNRIINTSCLKSILLTLDPNMMFDGDLYTWPDASTTPRAFTFSRGPEIPLPRAV